MACVGQTCQRGRSNPGNSGIGKTHLIDEWKDESEGDGLCAVDVAARQLGKSRERH